MFLAEVAWKSTRSGRPFRGSSGGVYLLARKHVLDAARAQLDPATFAAAWAEGQAMSLEEAFALATETESDG
jgi:hypothetical protein